MALEIYIYIVVTSNQNPGCNLAYTWLAPTHGSGNSRNLRRHFVTIRNLESLTRLACNIDQSWWPNAWIQPIPIESDPQSDTALSTDRWARVANFGEISPKSPFLGKLKSFGEFGEILGKYQKEKKVEQIGLKMHLKGSIFKIILPRRRAHPFP